MPKRTFLVLDCHYLAYRAFFSTRALSYGDVKTGVIFGFLKEVLSLKDEFGTDDIVFCFDADGSYRRDLFPQYKKKRHEKKKTEEELEALGHFRKQVKKLRKSYLPQIGFRNVLFEDGFESDDLIASFVQNLPETDEATIITADKDLYQLIRPNVHFHNPDKHKTMTYQGFIREMGMPPEDWWKVLCLAGCKTDEVPGIRGIGVKTALSYLKGTLKKTNKTYGSIKSPAGRETIRFNRKLVKLPFRGTPPVVLQEDDVSPEGWVAVTKELGIRSLKIPTLRGRRPRAGFNV